MDAVAEEYGKIMESFSSQQSNKMFIFEQPCREGCELIKLLCAPECTLYELVELSPAVAKHPTFPILQSRRTHMVPTS
jgi:hypothetical protein